MKVYPLPSWVSITPWRLGDGHSVGMMAVSNIMGQSETQAPPAGSRWSSWCSRVFEVRMQTAHTPVRQKHLEHKQLKGRDHRNASSFICLILQHKLTDQQA